VPRIYVLPDLPTLDAPRVKEQQLEVCSFAEHPEVRGEHEVGLRHVNHATPNLKM